MERRSAAGAVGAAGRGPVTPWGVADNVATVLGVAALVALVGAGDWYWRKEGVAVAKAAAPLAQQAKSEPEAPAQPVSPAPAPVAAPKEETAAAPAIQVRPRAEAVRRKGRRARRWSKWALLPHRRRRCVNCAR